MLEEAALPLGEVAGPVLRIDEHNAGRAHEDVIEVRLRPTGKQETVVQHQPLRRKLGEGFCHPPFPDRTSGPGAGALQTTSAQFLRAAVRATTASPMTPPKTRGVIVATKPASPQVNGSTARQLMPSRLATSGPPISLTSSGGPTTTSLSVARERPTYSRSRERSLTFDSLAAQHHDSALEALEAEHVTVEDLVGVPEGVPVAVLPQLLLTVHLLLVARPSAEQRDVLGPPVLEQVVDLVARDVEGLLERDTGRR